MPEARPKHSEQHQARALLLDNIGQLVTPTAGYDDAQGPRRLALMRALDIVEQAAVFCLDGEILWAGKRERVIASAEGLVSPHQLVRFDCLGGVVVPGFCDSHTHPAFVAPRLIDFEKRLAGASYQEIAEAGGGIRSSVATVRAASPAELEEEILFALRQMALEGTTTVEAKSGYGLDLESELKSLRAIRNVAVGWQGTVYTTLLGAHVVPAEYVSKRDEYVQLVCEQMIPQAAAEQLADFVDVFCERGAFTPQETRHIFSAAERYRIPVRAHVGQFSPANLALFEEFQPVSFDHLDHFDEAGLRWLATHDTLATLMPGANFFLGHHEYPRARTLIDGGAPVALATDYNPGTSPTTSMPFVMSVACTHMQMTPAEALVAATINGAHALRVADRKGTVQPGKDADLAVFGVDDYREIPYWIAQDNCLATVIDGELID